MCTVIRRCRLAWCLAWCLALTAITAVTVAAQTAAAATVLQGRSTSDVVLSNLANVDVTIVSVTLPAAGVYAAVGRASVVNWTGQEDSTVCALWLNGAALDGAYTVTGGLHAPSAAGLTTAAKVTSTAPNQVLTLQCSHTRTVAGIKVDGGAELLVTDAAPGPKGAIGAAGPTGSTGPTGPSLATAVAACVSVNATNPTSQSCYCANGRAVTPPQFTTRDAPTCTATGQAGSCSASGYTVPNLGGHQSGACCVCGL